jgi:hypothetical protein
VDTEEVERKEGNGERDTPKSHHSHINPDPSQKGELGTSHGRLYVVARAVGLWQRVCGRLWYR